MKQTFTGHLRHLCPPHTIRQTGADGQPDPKVHDHKLALFLDDCTQVPSKEVLALQTRKGREPGEWVKVTIETEDVATETELVTA